MTEVPIVPGHDYRALPIGKFEGGVFTMAPGHELTTDQFFACFPGPVSPAIEILETVDGKIAKWRVLAWGLEATK